MNKSLPAVLAIILTGYLAFMALESRLPFVETSDARYAEISYETLVDNQWIVPHQNRMKHLTKPPLTYWFTALAYKMMGVNEGAARFFSGIFGILCALLIFFMGRRLDYTFSAALIAALAFLTLPLVMASGRILTTDIFQLFFFLVAMDGFIRLRFHRQPRGVWHFWIGLGLAGMAKGPIGLLLALGIIVPFLLWEKDLKWIRNLVRPVPVLVFIVLAFWWPVYIFLTVPGSFDYLVVKQMLSRVSEGGFGHPKPIYYYFLYFPLSMLPWIPFITVEIVAAIRHHDLPRNRLLLAWILFPLVFFTIPSSKLILYMLPATAACALLAGECVSRSRLPMATLVMIGIELLVVAISIGLLASGKLHPPTIMVRNEVLLLLCVLLSGGLAMLLLRAHPVPFAVIHAGRFLAAILLVVHLAEEHLPSMFFTTKPSALFLNSQLADRPGPIICEGFTARGFILYTGHHTYDGDADVETYPDEFQNSPYILEPPERETLWDESKHAYLIRKSWNWAPVPPDAELIWTGKRFNIWQKKAAAD